VSRIVAVKSVFPEFVSTQSSITAEFAELVTQDNGEQNVLRRIHGSSGVRTRHTVLPIKAYRTLDSFEATNDLFIRHGVDLAERAAVEALALAEIEPREVDFFFFTSVTGVAAPSLDALLVEKIGLRADVKRVPSFGLGCVAGAAALARAHDYLIGHPCEVAVVVAVELCSLTVQRDDASMANIVASGLFGDGAAAAVLTGSERQQGGATWRYTPEIVATASRIYPDTGDMIGWRIGSTGFRIVLSAGLPGVIDGHFAADVTTMLGAHQLATGDIAAWIAHPGGPKILEAFERCLTLNNGELARSWSSLARVGNLSSVSVLDILADTIGGGTDPGSDFEPVPPGAFGLLFSLGPGVSSELVLLRWPEESE